jgi:UDP-N-acetylmuramate dehydrogenase
MRIADAKLLAALRRAQRRALAGASLAERTSLGIGGTTDVLLLIRRHASLPDLDRAAPRMPPECPHRFLGGGSNVLIDDGELPWVILQLARQEPEWRFEGTSVWVDAAADLGRTVTTCAKRDLGGMEGLIGVPGSVGGALRMNAGAYGTQIGSYVREVEVFQSADAAASRLCAALKFHLNTATLPLRPMILCFR